MKNKAVRKITLLTSGQPAINPRLVKEADTLSRLGYEVVVLYQYWNEWATQFDKELLAAKNWKAIRVGGSPSKNKYKYWQSRLKHKAAVMLAKKMGFRTGLAELAIGRCTPLLYKEALKHPADLYIAHNLAALPAAVNAAKRRQVKCGFDAEDFHRNEMTNDPAAFDVRIKTYIENKYFPQVDYLTTSSPQIAGLYRALFPLQKITTVRNVFPKTAITSRSWSPGSPLRLLWFSQSVGFNRGLGDVVQMLKTLEKEAIECCILGNLTPVVKEQFLVMTDALDFQHRPALTFHPPVHPDELIAYAAQYDIGLALEPGFSINNDNALSNKIFTYINAGLAIIASDTIAQSAFFYDNPAIGRLYKPGDHQALAALVKSYLDQPDSLRSAKEAAFEAGQSQLNWETESGQFISVIQNVLA